MQTVTILTLLLVASVAATHSSEVPSAQAGQPQGTVPVGNAPVQPANVANQPPVEGGPVHSSVEQPQMQHHQQQNYPSMASYYAPAGMMTVVGAGEQQVGAGKPVVGGVRNFEQYGQPESASIPANYKPFGSWGLYIGGNPADGYYTNYYKALSNSVDKQQVSGEQPKPGQVMGSQTAAFSPFIKQAGSSPYGGGDYYPFAYSTAELNSGSRVSMEPMHPAVPHSSMVSPPQTGAQTYASPVSYEPNTLSYADSYATKKVGSAFAQKEEKSAMPHSSKGYQSRMAYVYSAPVGMTNSMPPMQSVGQQQVVAYPVPVGSQMVGSQPGVDGAFNPYGVHAFTRYAVKPAVVNSDQSYYYSVHSPASQFPAYKQSVYTSGVSQPVAAPAQAQHQAGGSYQPMSFYGYPMSQLHYSQGSIVPSGVQHYSASGMNSGVVGESPVVGVHHGGPVQPNQVEAASEKSEVEDKSFVNKQQKKA